MLLTSLRAACASSVTLVAGRAPASFPARPERRRPGRICRRTVVPAFAANQLNDVVQAPADHIRVWCRLPLADRDDAIVGIEVAGLRRGAALRMLMIVT